ncbi:MAG: SRPBCC domain-containing protein [Candidatus Kapaibacterium sp.]
MRIIETEIIIDKNVKKVWEKLMDFDSHRKWNPFITSISGSKEVEETLEVTMNLNKLKNMSFYPKVILNNLEKEFRWKGKLFIEGLFDGEHYFIFEKRGNDKCKFIQGEIFTGLLANALFKMIGKETENGFNSMNKSFKEFCEK